MQHSSKTICVNQSFVWDLYASCCHISIERRSCSVPVRPVWVLALALRNHGYISMDINPVPESLSDCSAAALMRLEALLLLISNKGEASEAQVSVHQISVTHSAADIITETGKGGVKKPAARIRNNLF